VPNRSGADHFVVGGCFVGSDVGTHQTFSSVNDGLFWLSRGTHWPGRSSQLSLQI